MGPYYYKVNRIDGDYAYLIRTDISDSEEMIVARALLPEDIDINTKLKWENLVYTILN
ncbi:MAG: chorismate--pyruvate lyase [Acutalibacteraceae bacterium]